MTDAALGATTTIPTLDGEVELELEPGTQPGELRVLRGQGMPLLQGRGRGDHRVLVNVLVPRRLSDEQRRLLEEFARAADGDTYAQRRVLRPRPVGVPLSRAGARLGACSSGARRAGPAPRLAELAPGGWEEGEHADRLELAVYGRPARPSA